MLNRILAACIICFWLVMNALLLRVEISPGDSRITDIPPAYVFKLMFRHAQPTDLTVFENKKSIGNLSLRPQPVNGQDERVVDFTGNLEVGLPLTARQRVAWDGSLEMNRQLEVRAFRFNSHPQDSEYTTHIEVDAEKRMIHFSVSLKGKQADTRSFSMDDIGKSGLLSQLGLDDSLLEGIKSHIAAPVVTAKATELVIGSEKMGAYRLTVQQERTTIAQIYVSQLGQVLEVTTPFGYTLSTEPTPP